MHSDGPRPDWYGDRPKFEIQKTVCISKKMQSHLKNHFGDAWKQKTMAYFISNRINPIFGTVEYFSLKFSENDKIMNHKTFFVHFRLGFDHWLISDSISQKSEKCFTEVV